jgi:excisionase family DNA binding protein
MSGLESTKIPHQRGNVTAIQRSVRTVVEPELRDPRTSDSLCMSVAAVARTLGVSADAVYELVHRGELPSLRIGRRLVVPRRAVEVIVEQLLAHFDAKRVVARLSDHSH